MPWIFMLLFVGYMAAEQYESPQTFDPVEWKSGNQRQTMVKDLVESKILIGKRKDEILDLLEKKKLRPIVLKLVRNHGSISQANPEVVLESNFSI